MGVRVVGVGVVGVRGLGGCRDQEGMGWLGSGVGGGEGQWSRGWWGSGIGWWGSGGRG